MKGKRFTTINQIPKALRRVGDGALTLEQAEALINTAQAKADKTATPFAVCLGQERAAFEAAHRIQHGFWVAKN